MAKRRCLNKIRIPQNNVANGQCDTTLTTEEVRNINSSNVDERTNTLNGLQEETRLSSSSEHSRALISHSDKASGDDSDTIEHTVKCRGPTILADIWNQSPDEKWVVKFNREGQPYGEESSVLASVIGTIGRNPELAPQGYSDWRISRKNTKTGLRFSFPRCGENHIKKALGRTVKDFRGELKATYYEPNKHNRTSLENAKPPWVPRDQYFLILFCILTTGNVQRRSTINRINQKNQNMPHCAGRQSFAQLRTKKTIDSVESSRAQIFIDTHKDRKTRDKKSIDEESAKAVEKMKEKLGKLPNGIEQMNGKIAWKCDIFDQVIGKEERRGRVRGVGGGVCASKLWGDFSGQQQSSEQRGEDSSKLVEKLLNDIKVMQHKHSEEMRVLQEKRDLELKMVVDKHHHLESHIHELVSLFAQRAPTRGQGERGIRWTNVFLLMWN
ncbi:hypothetical protein RND81_04G021800 [Saponaria officinalis]|uniref:Uncharacterized protein n=1 Tax=Saponaria officinalis TaxID=3572 RepID=A0AAW1LCC3_SAPOF